MTGPGHTLSKSLGQADARVSVAPTRRVAHHTPAAVDPACEVCAVAAVELSCGCCGQEQCRSCWADGEYALCGTCRGRAWDDVPPEGSVLPVGLLVGDEEAAALCAIMISWSA